MCMVISSLIYPQIVWLMLLAAGGTFCLACPRIIQFRRLANRQSFDRNAPGKFPLHIVISQIILFSLPWFEDFKDRK